MLRQDRDVVWRQAQPAQRACETRVLATTTGAQGAEARSWNGGVGAVAVGSGVGDHGEYRKAQLLRETTAHKQDGAATLALEEAAAAAVVGAGDEALVDALRSHRCGLRGGVHVAKALQRLDLNVVDATGDHDVGLAQCNLVDALLDGHRGRGAGADGVDHRAVSADQGLHGVRRDDVRQCFLQDVGWALLAEEAGDEDLVQGLHAADAGALRGGNLAWVDRLQQLSRGEAGLDEGVDGRDQVPDRHAVECVEHVVRDAPAGGVEVVWHLRGHGAGERGLARYLCGGALAAGDLPFAVSLADAGELWVGLGDVAGGGLGIDGEGDVAVQEHCGQVDGAAVNQVVLIGELADAGAGHDLVVETLVDVLFRNLFVSLTDEPARRGLLVPCDEAGHPRELDDTGGGQLGGAVALQTVLGLEAGAAGTPGAYLADTGDDHHVVEIGGDVAKFLSQLRLHRAHRGRQCLDAGGGVLGGTFCSGLCSRLLDL